MQRRAGYHAAHPGAPHDHQSAGDRGDEYAPCVRQPDRVLRQAPEVPRQRDHLYPPPQRPRHRRSLCRAGSAGGCTARGVLPVRQRRAHRQCGRRNAGHEYVQPRRRPQAGLLGYARHLRYLRAGDPDAHLRAHPLRRAAGICRLFRQSSGCHCQGHGVPQADRRAPLDLPLYPGGPPRHRPHLRRRRHPHQQPERQGRHRLCAGTELRLQPAPQDAGGTGLQGQECVRPQPQGAERRRGAAHLRGYLPQPRKAAERGGSPLCTGKRHYRHGHAGTERPAQGGHLGGQRPSGCCSQRHPERHRHGLPSGKLL